MRVLVVGAGLGGLTAALALQAAGIEVEVHEQTTVLGEVGAGLTLSRGAQQVLAELGLLGEILARASLVRSNAFLHYRTGALLDGAVDTSDGAAAGATAVGPNVQLHRADLHAVLAGALASRAPTALRLGHTLVDVAERAGFVRATFADGTRADGDLLVGADGLRSPVRTRLWGAAEPRFTGQVAFRALVPGPQAAPFVADAGRAAVYLGPDRVFNRYALRRGAVVNCVAIARTADWREDGWSTPGNPDDLAALFADWHPDVRGLMALALPGRLNKWALCARRPLATWQQGRVALLGDAAHPMLPFLGLGAAMAIEDAAVLGRAFAAAPGNPVQALARYDAARRPRATAVADASARQGLVLQARDPDHFQGDAAPVAQADLFDYDPLGVAV